MKKVLFTILLVSLMTGFYGCINDAKLTFLGEVIGAGEPVFDESLDKEVGKTATTVTVKASVIKENGYAVTERGFIYGLNENPSLENGGIKLPDPQGAGLGEYTMTIEGLTNNKTYHIRSYADNKKGTGYGPDIPVWTNVGVAQVSTLPPKRNDIHSTSAIVGGEVTIIGEGSIFQLGFYVYEKDKSDQIDTIYYHVSEPREAVEGEQFFCQLSDLKPATWYYVRAFIKNVFGEMIADADSLYTLDGKPKVDEITIRITGFTDVSVLSQVSDGGDSTVQIIERGFCWSETATPSITNDTIRCGAGTGVFEGTITDLESDKTYYVCAYAISDRNIIEYGEVKMIQTNPAAPTVGTEDAEHVNNGGVDLKGTIKAVGQSPITSSGICWSTNPEPTIENDSILPLIAMYGEFSGRLTGLKGGTRYYIRAYAINSYGTGYGEIKHFTTPPVFTTGLNSFIGGYRIANTMAYFAIRETHLYVLGGDQGANYTNELYQYSIADNRWVALKAFSDSPMKWQSGVSFGSAAFVYGGNSGLGDEKPGIYEYDEQKNVWYYHDGPDSSIVHSVLGYSYRSIIYYVGGWNADNTLRDDVWSFNPPMKTWERKTDFPVKQYGGIAVVIDDMAYVGMGKNSADVCNDSIWTSDDDGLTWNYRTSYPVAGTVWGGVVCNKRLYIVDKDYYIVEYNPVTNVWTKKSKIINNMTNLQCIYAIDNKIYIGAGNYVTLVVYEPAWDN